MKKILISSFKPYAIHLATDLFATDEFKNFCHSPKPKVLISDSNVGPLYKNSLLKIANFEYIEIPAGEKFKTREMKQFLEDKLFEKGYGRNVSIFALGGGVILDLVGFLASTYARGVDLVYLPTTLLAMVDVIVGGKTAINTPFSKNSIGTFYTPSSVWIDLNVLKTLDSHQYSSGMMEVIKHALLFDKSFLIWLREHIQELLNERTPDLLGKLICQSIDLKAKVIEQDEHEEGPRKLLNFGHTIGHAIEHLSGYQILHGHAVGLGMLLEAYIAAAESEVCNYLEYFLKTMNVLFDKGIFQNNGQLIKSMMMDKKNTDHEIHMVYLPEIAQYKYLENQYTFPVSTQQIQMVISWYIGKYL